VISCEPAPRGIRRLRVVALFVGVVALAWAFDSALSASARMAPAKPMPPAPAHEHRAARGEAAGAVPAGTTVFDGAVPGVARLDPALLDALRRASTDAGITFVVNSGWRSAGYEDRLRREAIAKYGSAEEAARWVATGATSPHVAGHAVDLGPSAATSWLSAHGAAYGLCPIYANEPWHYELRPGALADGCPAPYADPTQDPRMQR
jgi:zinc D-Ala-D-Ala carboxypeptidase